MWVNLDVIIEFSSVIVIFTFILYDDDRHWCYILTTLMLLVEQRKGVSE